MVPIIDGEQVADAKPNVNELQTAEGDQVSVSPDIDFLVLAEIKHEENGDVTADVNELPSAKIEQPIDGEFGQTAVNLCTSNGTFDYM